MILTQADVIRASRVTGTLTVDQLADTTDIQSAVNTYIGSYAGTDTATWSGAGRSGPLVLPWAFDDVVSVTVTTGGVPVVLAPDQYGIVGQRSGILYGTGAWPTGSTVTVVTSRTAAPGNVRQAAMMLARHYWQLAQNGGRAAWADENTAPASTRIPQGVHDLLDATGLPGFG